MPAALLIAAICVGIAAQRAGDATTAARPRARAAAAALDSLARKMRLAELEGYSDAAVARVHEAAAATTGALLPPSRVRRLATRAGVYGCWQFTRIAWRVSRMRPAGAAALLAVIVGALWAPLIIGALAVDGWGVVALWGATSGGGPVTPLPEVHRGCVPVRASVPRTWFRRGSSIAAGS